MSLLKIAHILNLRSRNIVMEARQGPLSRYRQIFPRSNMRVKPR